MWDELSLGDFAMSALRIEIRLIHVELSLRGVKLSLRGGVRSHFGSSHFLAQDGTSLQ